MPRKPSRKTLKLKCDKAFANYVKQNGACEWCGTRRGQLQCAHIFSRRFLVTRWQPINALALCASCHRKGHDKPVEFVEFIREYLGEEIYNELRREAKTSIKKVDLEEVWEKYKEYYK